MIIEDASILLGRELTFVSQGFIEIGKNGIIIKAGAGSYSKNNTLAKSSQINRSIRRINAEGFLVSPGFINAHTHIGDSIGKDVGVESGLDTRVHPIFGITGASQILYEEFSDIDDKKRHNCLCRFQGRWRTRRTITKRCNI